jgi:hypothetical protein
LGFLSSDYTTVNSDIGTIESDLEIQKTDYTETGKVISDFEEVNNDCNRYTTLHYGIQEYSNQT